MERDLCLIAAGAIFNPLTAIALGHIASQKYPFVHNVVKRLYNWTHDERNRALNQERINYGKYERAELLGIALITIFGNPNK